MHIHRLFKRGELAAISREALRDVPRDTRQLTLAFMAAKGLDTGDHVLAKAVSYRLIHVQRIQARNGKNVETPKFMPVSGFDSCSSRHEASCA